MEIMTNAATRQARLNVPLTPLNGQIDVIMVKDNVTFEPSTVTVDPDNGDFLAGIPFAFVKEDGPVYVDWSFQYEEFGETFTYTGQTVVDVVTPYLTVEEIKAVAPNFQTTEKALELEGVVRRIINTYCGQSFGKAAKTVNVRGRGDGSLQLPERLISFTGVETNAYVYNPAAYQITADGFFLRQTTSSLQTIKQMPNDYSLDAGPVIVTPNTAYYRGFTESAVYSITGVWGWETVPEPVKTAARLLAEDYGCNEVAYRDKYLESIKAADWRLQVGSESWDHTGNARADALLAPYVLLEWAVV